MRILVVGAHPDDEILGCGGTIAKYISQGHEAFVCICTRAYMPDWTKEYIENQTKWQKNVDKYLGIAKRFNFDYPTVMLNNIPHGDLSRVIAKVIKEVNPAVVFTHFEGDLDIDHFMVARTTFVACRPPKRIKLFSYEVLSNTEHGQAFKPNYYEVLSKTHFARKMKAYKLYKVESKKITRTSEKLENLAKKRAHEILVNYAEAFQIIREVNR